MTTNTIGKKAAATAVALLAILIIIIATSSNSEAPDMTTTTPTTTEWTPAADSAAGQYVAAVRTLTFEAHDPTGLSNAQLVGLFASLCQLVDDADPDADIPALLTQAYIDGEFTADTTLAAKLGATTADLCSR